jgi:hypothetical protein
MIYFLYLKEYYKPKPFFMRKKQKQGSRFLFGTLGLFLIGIAFGGCEKELFEDSLYKDKMTIKKVSFEEFKRNLKAHEKFKTIREGTRNDAMMARYEYNEEYGVYFDPDNIKLITKDNLKNYTIPLLKEPNDSLIKNLVLSEKPDLSYSAKILGYKLTDEEIELIKQGINPNLTNKIYEKRIDGGSNVSNSYSNLCGLEINFTYVPNYCCDGIHYYGQPCNYDGTDCSPPPFSVIIEVVYVLCPEESVGGPTPPSGPVNPTNPPTDPGGGLGGDGSNPDDGATTPINNEAEEEVITTLVLPGLAGVTEIEDPCFSLKKLFENDSISPHRKPDIKPKVEQLNEIIASGLPHEGIYSLSKNSKCDYSTSNLTISPTGTSALPKYGGDFYGSIHSHWFLLYPMLTWSDVFSLKTSYMEAIPSNRTEAITIMVAKECLTCESTVVYAIKIDNWNTFRAKIGNELFNNPDTENFTEIKDKIKVVNDQFAEKFRNGMNNQELEQLFLENFANHGISLYKANDELDNWSKLTLSGNQFIPVTKTPCN